MQVFVKTYRQDKENADPEGSIYSLLDEDLDDSHYLSDGIADAQAASSAVKPQANLMVRTASCSAQHSCCNIKFNSYTLRV